MYNGITIVFPKRHIFLLLNMSIAVSVLSLLYPYIMSVYTYRVPAIYLQLYYGLAFCKIMWQRGSLFSYWIVSWDINPVLIYIKYDNLLLNTYFTITSTTLSCITTSIYTIFWLGFNYEISEQIWWDNAWVLVNMSVFKVIPLCVWFYYGLWGDI